MNPRVIVALDYDRREDAEQFVSLVKPEDCLLKVGLQMFTKLGPDFVKSLTEKGFGVFLDLKFYDIPNTVAGAVRSAASLGVKMLTVHAAGGPLMLKAAVEAASQFPPEKRPLLLGVTVLTSIDEPQLDTTGVTGSVRDQVLRLATLALGSGLDGVVCSAMEAADLRRVVGPDFRLVTPGIRPKGTDRGDQKRIFTPEAAVQAGSDYLVIGRPITRSDDPAGVLRQINSSIENLTAAE